MCPVSEIVGQTQPFSSALQDSRTLKATGTSCLPREQILSLYPHCRSKPSSASVLRTIQSLSGYFCKIFDGGGVVLPHHIDFLSNFYASSLLQEPDEAMLYWRTLWVYVWLQWYEVCLQIVTFRVKKVILLNTHFFKVSGVQDLLISSPTMPSYSLNR